MYIQHYAITAICQTVTADGTSVFCENRCVSTPSVSLSFQHTHNCRDAVAFSHIFKTQHFDIVYGQYTPVFVGRGHWCYFGHPQSHYPYTGIFWPPVNMGNVDGPSIQVMCTKHLSPQAVLAKSIAQLECGLPTAAVSCSNAAKTRNPLKLAWVPQTTEPISAASGP